MSRQRNATGAAQDRRGGQGMYRTGRRLPAVLLLLGLVTGGVAPESPEPAALDPVFSRWLEEVDLLLSEREREVFATLARDYQRHLFIERFWKVRDPFRDTAANEFRETWEYRVALAHQRFGGLDGPRAQALLLAGPPDRILGAVCPLVLRSLEIWLYARSPRVPREFSLVFLAQGRQYRIWSPGEGLQSLLRFAAGGAATTTGVAELLTRECATSADAVAALLAAADWRLLNRRAVLVPRPSDEWVEAFLARTTELPASAQIFPAEVRFHFPGRRQSRTAVEGLITVPRAEAALERAGDDDAYHFDVEGEVLRDEELFDRFRYRFDLQAAEADTEYLPLVVRRYLRPGDYTLILKIKDRNSGRYHRSEQELTVPVVEAFDPTAASPPVAHTPHVPAAAALERILAEAHSGETAREQIVRILPPPEGLHTGRLRVEAAALGEEIRKVRFDLNGRPILAKTRPPFSVELELGRAPRRHRLEAVALDAGGEVVARDEITLNAGPHSFDIRLIEPQPRGRYERSLTAFAEVSLPAGEDLDRVEFYLNETLLATLYQEPFVQPIVLPEHTEISYVKAVAYLADGHSDHDIAFVNAPDHLEQLEIHLVELFTTVVNRKGQPVEGLAADAFTVLEDGIEQRIRRVERVTNLPISAGIVLDTSTSMIEELHEAEKAAMEFFERVLRPQDRAAVVVFNDSYELKVPLTNRTEELASGLSGLAAEGETALYDSLAYALYYFSGMSGKRAVVLLTDGRDSCSRYRYDELLEFARRSGVAIYAIAIDLSSQEFEVLSKLKRLAHETGGECYTINRASELKSIYERIEQELRTQYVLSYQSSQVGSEEYRQIEVRLAQPGLRAKTIPGYFP